MEDVGLGSSGLNDLGVDLVAAELGGAVLGFLLLAHADPDIGVEDVGTTGGILWIVGDVDISSGPGDEFGGRTVEFGAGKAELKAEAA